jgi:hypothetical protein
VVHDSCPACFVRVAPQGRFLLRVAATNGMSLGLLVSLVRWLVAEATAVLDLLVVR